MIVETVRIVADALRDTSTGVNARLHAQVVDAHDAVPQVASIRASTEDDAVAAGEPISDWPVLFVAPGGPFEIDGATPSARRTTRPSMPIDVAYVSDDRGDAAERLRNAEHTARAVTGVLSGMGQPERNGVCVLGVESYVIDPLPTLTATGHEVVMVVTANLIVRDTTP